MKRLKMDNETLDRLSGLSDSLILKILSFLEMKDVVRTTLVSKRWKDLWTNTSCFDFNESITNLVQTRNFIYGVLQHWKGTKILKFKINFSSGFDVSLSVDMDMWVGFATEKKVEELYLSLPYDYQKLDPDKVLLPPQSIYSCWSITTLSLVGYSFEIMNVQWDRLKSLTLHGYSNSEELIDQVVCSTPQLEILDAYIFGRHQKLSIRSSSLRTLVVASFSSNNSLTYGDELLAICAPSLQTLSIYGPPYSTCLLSDVSSLSDVTLDFHDICYERVGGALEQILPAVQHIEALTLSHCCFKMLGVMKYEYSFPNVKTLMCRDGPIEPYDIAGVAEYFPKVEKLFIDLFDDEWTCMFMENLSHKHDFRSKWLELESEKAKKQLKFVLMQLKTVEVIWYETALPSMFRIIKFLSKHATMLQKIVIKKEGNDVIKSKSMIRTAQRLMSLQRSFPHIDVIFFHN